MRARQVAAAAIALALFTQPVPASAAPMTQITAEILEFGITAGRRQFDEPGQRGHSGLAPAGAMRDVRYLERTDRIEARLCRHFGLRLKLAAESGGALPSRVEVRVLHPTFTRPDGRTSTEDRFPSYVNNDMTHVGFTFDHDWEMQPGRWSVIVAVKGREIARKDFIITVPPPGAPNSDCGVG